jgi:predicted nucleic acid-binding protein
MLFTELHCAIARNSADVSPEDIANTIREVSLVELKPVDLQCAADLERLRTNDAIHLATALRVGVQQILAYDDELLAAAQRQGIEPLSPGYRVPSPA